ncbi:MULTISPECIES: DeoR/GlpR family DNA-binding transcription regulator [Amycolatopsis]|uniref:DeoR/GlpR family DNA-binding transcription regulator n=1 Tax=Amycolatopsis dongchuanensis TaxID=1070866 RepID=A0ABP9QBR3_9PSEU
MNRDERLNTLLEMVGRRDRIEVEETAKELRVSPATIRRDLDHLAGRQLLIRTRGGAVRSSVAYDLSLRYGAGNHAEEKRRIGEVAAQLVRRGMIVGLNGGTTTTEVGRALAVRPEFNESTTVPALTVVTNALNIAHELAVRQCLKIVTTGGVAGTGTFELTGPLATPVLREVRLDLAFIGVDALDAARGLYHGQEADAEVTRLLASQAREVVAVADSTKLGAFAFARICATRDVQMLITDTNADPAHIAAFEAEGTQVLLA